MKIKFFATLLFSLIILTSANATTSYKTVEINRELRLFEIYLNSLSQDEAIEKIKLIGSNEEKWIDALKKLPNTITSAHYHKNGDVIFTNDTFKFQIIFISHVEDLYQIWSCRINDGSIFFKPMQCVNWIKKINISDDASPKNKSGRGN